ncbi:MAG TPA: hypothetical protein VLF67_01935 [Candidatus Saccharimonas sp.]|nr:hypothetical protein [Candidatus Saccharimonas sp.]
MRRSHTLFLVPVAALAFALTGCGGWDDGPSVAAPAATSATAPAVTPAQAPVCPDVQPRFCVSFMAPSSSGDVFTSQSFPYDSATDGTYQVRSYGADLGWDTRGTTTFYCTAGNKADCGRWDGYNVFVWTPNHPQDNLALVADDCRGLPNWKQTLTTFAGEPALRETCNYQSSPVGERDLVVFRHAGLVYELYAGSPFRIPAYAQAFFDSFKFA